MASADVRKSDSKLLARLLDFNRDQERLWEPSELQAILHHQLSSAVQFDLSSLPDGFSSKLRSLSEASGLLLRSFADLFVHPHPPIELLELTKQFAKASCSSIDSPLPREVAAVLYFTSIVVARVRWGRRITELGDEILASNLRWVLAQPWVEAPVKELVTEGLKAISRATEVPMP